MTIRPNWRVLQPIIVIGSLVGLLAACSGGDGTDIDARGATGAETTATTTSIASPDAETDVGTVTGSALAATLPGESVVAEPTPPPAEPAPPTAEATYQATTPTPPPAEPTASVPLVSDVPETGIPGLDSDDAFCSAWSQFGGSFQVVAVNAAFGVGSVEERAFIEVVAGPTVVAAHAEMTANWPDQIEAESTVALDEAFGPLAERLGAASGALADAGLTPEQSAALDDAWLAFLAERDPTDVEVNLVLDDELGAIVVAAVPGYLDVVGPWAEDESLITDVSIPLTDAYLAAECPDQGTLAGGEVEG